MVYLKGLIRCKCHQAAHCKTSHDLSFQKREETGQEKRAYGCAGRISKLGSQGHTEVVESTDIIGGVQS